MKINFRYLQTPNCFLQRVFRGVLDPEEDLLLKYKDEDGDLITIVDNSDLSFAIQYCRVLRLTIIVGVEDRQKKAGNAGAEVTKELREVRDRFNNLLDLLTDSSKVQTIVYCQNPTLTQLD